MSGNGKISVNWDSVGLSPDQIALAYKPKAKRPAEFKRSTQPYIKFPIEWVERLAGVGAHASTYGVAFYLLHRHWVTGKTRIPLPNKALNRRGVSRHSKWRALAQLEAAALIWVENRNGRSPFIHIRKTGGL